MHAGPLVDHHWQQVVFDRTRTHMSLSSRSLMSPTVATETLAPVTSRAFRTALTVSGKLPTTERVVRGERCNWNSWCACSGGMRGDAGDSRAWLSPSSPPVLLQGGESTRRAVGGGMRDRQIIEEVHTWKQSDGRGETPCGPEGRSGERVAHHSLIRVFEPPEHIAHIRILGHSERHDDEAV